MKTVKKTKERAGAVRETAGPRSLTRLLALFEVLATKSDGLSLSDLSVQLNSPKSSLLNIVRPLVAGSFLINTSGLYRLGPSIFRLASCVLNSWFLPAAVRPIMEELARRTGESVLLSVMDAANGELTYVDIAHSPHPVRYQIAIGTTRPLYANASGRVFLAFGDRAWRDSYISRLERVQQVAKPMSKQRLKQALQQIGTEGYAYSIDGYTVGMSSVAAPLLDGQGHCLAVLSIAGPTDRFLGASESLKDALLTAAQSAAMAATSAALRVESGGL